MGLDMFIKKRFHGNKCEEIAYWRKHPNLHGFIVKTFAKGIDECQEIPLNNDSLERIINAVSVDDLPHTDGFFFGKSSWHTKEDTLVQLYKIKEIMSALLPHEEIYYQASW